MGSYSSEGRLAARLGSGRSLLSPRSRRWHDLGGIFIPGRAADPMVWLGKRRLTIEVQHGDALAFEADVLVLKHADALYGVDKAAVRELLHSYPDLDQRLPSRGKTYIHPAGGGIAARAVLFVGVGALFRFGYGEIRVFARRALETLALRMPDARHVALTVHGPGYGLDESEAFAAEVAGFMDAITEGDCPVKLERITIVEAKASRAKRLEKFLEKLIPDENDELAVKAREIRSVQDRLRSAGSISHQKPHVFVAMPFAGEMDDIYHYGIQGAAHAAGYLCERADSAAFTGDVLQWMKRRIETAEFVIADLSNANPNVYLEVGYAWGRGRQTILLIQDIAHVMFDVQGHRLVRYKKIKDLEDSLRRELTELRGR